MIRFSLFGIPIEVHPWFWVTAAFLGGGLYADSKESILAVLLFVLAAFISILVHELGHALTMRRYAGGRVWISLWAMGGLAHSEGSRFTSWSRFWSLAAGPGAGFALGAAFVAVVFAGFPQEQAWLVLRFGLFGDPEMFRVPELQRWFFERQELAMLLRHFLWINFWWGMVNLLPVMPLDGGQIAELFVRPRRRLFLIGAVTAGAVALFGLLEQRYYIGLLFGYLAWQNAQSLRHWR